MAASFNGDFAKLVPRNYVAQRAFSDTVLYVEKYDTFHLRFIDREATEPLRVSSEPVEESTDYETGPDIDTEDSRIQHFGHFVLSFNEKRVPEMPHLGWRIGRGSGKAQANRDVDLLLVPPRDLKAKSLAAIHLLLRFNLRSGFLMLKGGSTKTPVEFKMDGRWEKLEYDEERLLFQAVTTLRAGILEYELEYIVEEKHRESYFNQRNTFLQTISFDGTGLRSSFQKLPGDSCIQKGQYVEFNETQGTGSVGWITRGMDIKTGNPVAIKEYRIISRRKRDMVVAEANMEKSFRGERGLLSILDAWCEHNHPDGCCNMEKFYIFMPHAHTDLSIKFWPSPDISRKTKLYWLREILEGLNTLHAMGIMHRDITLRNTLIMSIEPPRASICDYGHTTKEEYSQDTVIGPVHTLAPEVWTVSSDGPYTKKVDLWAYGYAIAEILGYSVAKYPDLTSDTPQNPQITHTRHLAILKMLHAHCNKIPEDASLVDLVSKLLTWKPGERWSAGQALKHICWDPIIQEQDEHQRHQYMAEEGSSRSKRIQVNDLRL